MRPLANWISAFGLRPQARCYGPIGVELAMEKLHLVQLQKATGGAVSLRAQASVPFPCSREELLASSRAFRTALRRGLGSDRFKGRRAVLAMPSGFFRTMPLSYHLGATQSEESVIAALMAERLDGKLADYVIDYLPVRSPSREGERLAIVAVSPREQVLAYLELARMAGLHVDALEIGPAAVRRLVGAMPSDGDSDIVLVINTGADTSYLTMIAGKRLLFDQEIRFGEQALLERLSNELDLSGPRVRDLVLRTGLQPTESGDRGRIPMLDTGIFNTLLEIVKPELLKLVEEIERAFVYVAAERRGSAVERVYLLGSLARWPGADSALSTIARVAITNMPNPLTLFTGEEGFADCASDNLAPELAVATGLALRGLCDDV